MQTIYDYLDYRAFLKAALVERQKKNPGFSLRYVSQKAGIRSMGFFSMVLQGKRTMAEKTAMRLASILKLGKEEKEYFLLLVRYNQARSSEEKDHYFSRITRAGKPGRMKTLALEQYDFYRKWHHSAIRELVALPEFREDPDWIAKILRPSIRPAEAMQSLALLKKLGLVRYGKNKRLIQSDPLLWQETPAHGDARTTFLRQFHRQMIGLAGEAIERFPANRREMNSLTMSLSGEALEHLKSRLADFEKELLEYIEKDKRPSTAIYQMNFQLFPLMETSADTGRK